MGVSTRRPEQDRLLSLERRIEDGIDRWAPFGGIAIGFVLTVITLHDDHGALVGVYVLTPAALGWAWWFVGSRPTGAGRPGQGPVYVTGLLAFMAALVWLSPIFGFMALAAYVAAFAHLAGRWRYLGLTVASVIVSFTYLGGRFREDFGLTFWVAYAAVIVLNTVAAGVFTWYGSFISQLSMQRKEIIDELDAANARLAEILEENATLHGRLMGQARAAGVLDERARMAREIHDTIAQGLTGIVTQLEAADAADPHVETAKALARESLTEARRSVAALAPGRLDTARLPEAICDMATKWAETAAVEVTFATTGDPRPLLPDLEVALYRVAQESLANAGKHAAASRVGLTLSYMDDQVVLDVRDDGSGFDPAAHTGPSGGSGFGLAAMEQRLLRVSGRCEVESAPGEGTAVSASVPAIPAELEEAVR